MAEPKENVLMEKIVSLCKRRGFIFQSSEIYGGINGFWDYGPLGAELKRNVKELWWNTMTRQRDDVAGLEATIIMHPQIWKASGHVDTFSDPMVDCKTCKGRFRADQTNEIPCPQKPSKMVSECHGEKTAPRAFNLMFQTYVGPVRDESAIAYLRPETAQAIFAQFKNVLETSRQRVPFGISQRSHAAQFHLPFARVRADGTGIFHQAGRSGGGNLWSRGNGGGSVRSSAFRQPRTG